MTLLQDKKLKKNLYGTAQRIKLTHPPGLGVPALDEIRNILNTPWFPTKFTPTISPIKNEIRINDIHLFSAIELLIRSHCLSDIRLIIFEGKVVGKSVFKKKCLDINWDFFVNKHMTLKIKVNSVASHAFHESGLREILSAILKDQAFEIVSGENTQETTCLYVDFYKNKLTISISLAGEPLYKRGYRGVLSASAPLREDAAACCIQSAIGYAKKFTPDFAPDALVIPFSGTGTFAFEYLQFYLGFSPVLFEREYALQKMPLFRQEHFNFLLKKAKEHIASPENYPQVLCIDSSEQANTALLENKLIFQKSIDNAELSFDICCDNFLKTDLNKLLHKRHENIFMPLNPPYGIRLSKQTNTVDLYKNIAKKINEIYQSDEKQNILGFILCPNEETWSAFCEALHCKNTSTYHFTQGGIDIRVCQFLILKRNF